MGQEDSVSTSQARQGGMAEVNGVQLNYEVVGSGKPIVFSHAGIADARMWDDQFDAFAQRYRVIRFDHRGMGRSTMSPGPFSLREDVYGLMRFLGVERAALVGCSMGGAAVLDCTLAHPDAVAALVLVDAGMSGRDYIDEDEKAQTIALEEPIEAAIERGDLDAANELEVRLWVDGPRRRPDQVNPAVREKVREMNLINLQRAKEFEQGQGQPLNPPAAGRLAEVRCPTLVIAGEYDVPTELKTADLLVAGIPGARKAVIQDAAHLPSMEKPEEFNRLVLDFLASAGW
jgi:pimeloyl-ACP methyl ester carboxylesterase